MAIGLRAPPLTPAAPGCDFAGRYGGVIQPPLEPDLPPSRREPIQAGKKLTGGPSQLRLADRRLRRPTLAAWAPRPMMARWLPAIPSGSRPTTPRKWVSAVGPPPRAGCGRWGCRPSSPPTGPPVPERRSLHSPAICSCSASEGTSYRPSATASSRGLDYGTPVAAAARCRLSPSPRTSLRTSLILRMAIRGRGIGISPRTSSWDCPKRVPCPPHLTPPLRRLPSG